MRIRHLCVTCVLVLAVPAHAEDKPVIAPAPTWVKAVALPPEAKDDGQPVRVLLSDQQIDLARGQQTVFSEFAVKIQSPQGLSAGNISLPWRPATDVLTVHKLLIRRGDKIIDVLASGQTFTVLRRETNLETATLDGVLTANIQPEGLQVGDIVDLAMSVTSRDPVLKDHVEAMAGGWNGVPIGRVHLRMQWPSDLKARLRQTTALPPLKPVRTGGSTSVEFSADNLLPIVPPKGAPVRYQLGRLVEVTDFTSWADLGALFAPLYDKASTLPANATLRAEIDRIAAASTDPVVRTEAALALVQDRVRYVALAMGAGALVPADAETTWTRRYGDCKAKTALLLAMLHALGIKADPVAVNATAGDGIDARLPMIGLFNHVLVKAEIGGRVYWLDGTRSGDTSLDRITVPSFDWGLPLVASGAVLTKLMPPPLAKPAQITTIKMDARGGIALPAPTHIEVVLSGDAAIGTNMAMAQLTGDVRDRAMRDYWRAQYDFIEVKTTSSAFDPKTGELTFTMDGLAKMDWSNGSYETDGTGVGYKADFTRDPGPDHDAPFAVEYPYYTKLTETILLPPGFNGKPSTGGVVDTTVAGIEYHRKATLTADSFTIERTERSIAPEFPASDAVSAQATLRNLAAQSVSLRKPAAYRPTDADLDAMMATQPTTAAGYVSRGNTLLDRGRIDDSMKDFDAAIALDADNAWAWADRAIAKFWKGAADDAVGKDIDAALAIDPKNPVALRSRGLLAERRGAAKDAVAAYTASLAVEPNNTFTLARRAAVYRTAGDPDAALADAAAAIKLNPALSDLYLLRANILRGQGKRDDALAEAAAVASANPKDAYAQVVAGGIYAAFAQDTDAMRAYDRALAIKPEAYIYLNRSLRRPKTDVAGRLSDLDAALKLDPRSSEALGAKANLLVDKGDLPGALAVFEQAIRESPGSINLLVNRGITYARAGQTALAEKDFASARAAATKADQFNNICWSKATSNVQLESALKDCDDALAKAPDVASYIDSRGFVLLRLGRYDDAIATYDRALAKAPALAASLFGRGVAWGKKGDKAKSVADIAAAEKNDPDVRAEFARYGVTPSQ
jgi:tetratricopeptide (TPR) repeat protein